MKKPSRVIKIITVLIAVFIGSVFIDSWLLEPNRIDQVCSEIQVGVSTTEVFAKAKEFNLRLIESRPEGKKIKFITIHGGAFGRYVCEIQHDDSHVIKSVFKKVNVR